MFPDEPTEEERQEELAEDNNTPFRPADDTDAAPIDDTHPDTDTGVDSDEMYQEGPAAATNAPQADDPSRELEDVSEISTEDTDDDSIGSPS